MSAFSAESDISETFKAVTNKLITMGKTIVVASKNENVGVEYMIFSSMEIFINCQLQILQHCNCIYLITNGKTSEAVDYVVAQQIPSFQEVIQNYKQQKQIWR